MTEQKLEDSYFVDPDEMSATEKPKEVSDQSLVSKEDTPTEAEIAKAQSTHTTHTSHSTPSRKAHSPEMQISYRE
jgi:hypothetical protein